MPRPALRTVLAAGIAAGALAAGAAGYALAQDDPVSPAGLTLDVNSFQILRQDTADDTPEHAFVMRQGERYQFRSHYNVDAAPQITTGHTYRFVHVGTGTEVDTAERTFDPEDPGNYNEFSAREIPPRWQPGVYRLEWTLRATADGETPVSQDGSLAFLLAGPVAP